MPEGRNYYVYFNGEREQRAVAADDSEGWVDVFKNGNAGLFETEPPLERLTGLVQFLRVGLEDRVEPLRNSMIETFQRLKVLPLELSESRRAQVEKDFTALAVHVLSLPAWTSPETPRYTEAELDEFVEHVKTNLPAPSQVGFDPAEPGNFRTVLVVGGRNIGRRLLAAHVIAQFLRSNPEALTLNAPVPMVGEPVEDDCRTKAREFLAAHPVAATFMDEDQLTNVFRSMGMRSMNVTVPGELIPKGLFDELRRNLATGKLEFMPNAEPWEEVNYSEYERLNHRLPEGRKIDSPTIRNLRARQRATQGRYRETFEPHRCRMTDNGGLPSGLRCIFSVGHAGDCSFEQVSEETTEEASPEDDIEERRRLVSRCGEPEPYGETDCTMPSGHAGPHLAGEGETARVWPQHFKTSFPAYLNPYSEEE
jgi:hypothetical protein